MTTTLTEPKCVLPAWPDWPQPEASECVAGLICLSPDSAMEIVNYVKAVGREVELMKDCPGIVFSPPPVPGV